MESSIYFSGVINLNLRIRSALKINQKEGSAFRYYEYEIESQITKRFEYKYYKTPQNVNKIQNCDIFCPKYKYPKISQLLEDGQFCRCVGISHVLTWICHPCNRLNQFSCGFSHKSTNLHSLRTFSFCFFVVNICHSFAYF